MNKTDLILKYFQKANQLTVENKEYQQSFSSLFNWLIENDRVDHDKTTKFFPNINYQAKIIAKEEGILSGMEEIRFLLKEHTHLSIKSFVNDGSQFKKSDTIAQIKGKTHDILGFERTILNILQRMSGIATQTNHLIKLVGDTPFIASTRKTPWMGLDKKAVAVGGGLTHRLSLSDGILIKDNHLEIISKATKTPQVITETLRHLGGGKQSEARFDSPEVERVKPLIEIEVTNEKQARQVIQAFFKQSTIYHLAILLDNFSPQRAKQTFNNLKKEFDLSSIIFEASGGINEDNIKDWAKTGVDILSLGALTHSARTANFSLEMV